MGKEPHFFHFMQLNQDGYPGAQLLDCLPPNPVLKASAQPEYIQDAMIPTTVHLGYPQFEERFPIIPAAIGVHKYDGAITLYARPDEPVQPQTRVLILQRAGSDTFFWNETQSDGILPITDVHPDRSLSDYQTTSAGLDVISGVIGIIRPQEPITVCTVDAILQERDSPNGQMTDITIIAGLVNKDDLIDPTLVGIPFTTEDVV